MNTQEEEHCSQEPNPEVQIVDDEGSEHDSGFEMPEVAEEIE
jgi:hypothetical protein